MKNKSYFNGNRQEISKIYDHQLMEKHYNKDLTDHFHQKTMEGLCVNKNDSKEKNKLTEEMMVLVKQLIKQELPFSVLS